MLGYYINIISRAGFFFARDTLFDAGLNGIDHCFVEYAAAYPGISQERLSVHFNKDKSAVAKAMVRLEEAGCIYREPNPQNKRENRIYLTDKGRQLVDRITQMKQDWNQVLEKGFSEQEREQFLLLCKRASENAVAYLEEK